MLKMLTKFFFGDHITVRCANHAVYKTIALGHECRKNSFALEMKGRIFKNFYKPQNCWTNRLEFLYGFGNSRGVRKMQKPADCRVHGVHRAPSNECREKIARRFYFKCIVQKLMLYWIIFIKIQKCVFAVHIGKRKKIEMQSVVANVEPVHGKHAKKYRLARRHDAKRALARLDACHDMRV